MTSIFQNENIATNVLNYLALKDSLSLSSVNKEMYKIKLNPAHNSIINTHYRNLVFKEIYFNDLDDEEKSKNKFCLKIKLSLSFTIKQLLFKSKNLS